MPGWPLPPAEDAIYPSTPGGITAPTLSSWQFKLNGITFGAGQAIGILKVSGLGGLPKVGSTDQVFPRDTGEYVGVDAMGGRDPAIDFIVNANIFNQMVSLGGAWFAGGVTNQPLWFQLPGLQTMCSMVRPRLRPTDWDTAVSAAGMWTPSVTWHATDPRLYAEADTASNPMSGSTLTSFSVTNAGNVETRPVIVLTGPLPQPQIILGAGTNPPTIAFASGTTIGSGDQVVIDMSTPHTVQYFTGGITNAPWNGGTGPVYNVFNWLDQGNTSWWTLAPGVSAITGQVSSGAIAAGQFELWWASAWML